MGGRQGGGADSSKPPDPCPFDLHRFAVQPHKLPLGPLDSTREAVKSLLLPGAAHFIIFAYGGAHALPFQTTNRLAPGAGLPHAGLAEANDRKGMVTGWSPISP